MTEPASTPYQIKVSEDAPFMFRIWQYAKVRGLLLLRATWEGELSSFPPHCPQHDWGRVELLDPPSVVALLAVLPMLLDVVSPERSPLMLELAGITAPSSQVGFFARWCDPRLWNRTTDRSTSLLGRK